MARRPFSFRTRLKFSRNDSAEPAFSAAFQALSRSAAAPEVPQRLKPPHFGVFVAALKRCSTQFRVRVEGRPEFKLTHSPVYSD